MQQFVTYYLTLVIFVGYGDAVGPISETTYFTPAALGSLEKSDSLEIKTAIRKYVAHLEQLDHAFNNSCLEDISAVISVLTSSNPNIWAIKMVDSFGKPESGLLHFAGRWTGSFSECRNVQYVNPRHGRKFRGEYCWAHFALQPKLMKTLMPGVINVPIQTAICIPNTCTDNQLVDAGKMLIDVVPNLRFSDYVNLTSVECLRDQSALDTTAGQVITLLFVLFVSVVLFATLHDVGHQFWTVHQENKLPAVETTEETPSHSLLLTFSAYTNAKKILSLKVNKQALPAINGLRVISLIWIIIGHNNVEYLATITNMRVAVDLSTGLYVTTFRQAFYGVDTFFFLSGFLLAYTYLNEYVKNNGRISWPKFYFHRFWRLSPPYFLILAFMMIGPGAYLGQGPFWSVNAAIPELCRKSWWANVLYINNFLPYAEQCMGRSWYLANDMQFYVLSPLLLILFTKSAKWAAIIAATVICLSSITTGYIGTIYNFPISADFFAFIKGTLNLTEMVDKLYGKPYAHVTPYIVGMVTGWFIQGKKVSIKMSKLMVFVGWLVALTMMMFTLLVVAYPIAQDTTFQTAYHSVGRLVWSICMTWVVVSCVAGYGGLITRFLSWRGWDPLSRISYCAYLWHQGIVALTISTTEVVRSYTLLDLTVMGMANVIFTIPAAFILTLFFESPFIALESRLLRGGKDLNRHRRTE